MLEDKSKIALYQYMEKIIDFTLKAAKGGVTYHLSHPSSSFSVKLPDLSM